MEIPVQVKIGIIVFVLFLVAVIALYHIITGRTEARKKARGEKKS